MWLSRHKSPRNFQKLLSVIYVDWISDVQRTKVLFVCILFGMFVSWDVMSDNQSQRWSFLKFWHPHKQNLIFTYVHLQSLVGYTYITLALIKKPKAILTLFTKAHGEWGGFQGFVGGIGLWCNWSLWANNLNIVNVFTSVPVCPCSWINVCTLTTKSTHFSSTSTQIVLDFLEKHTEH